MIDNHQVVLIELLNQQSDNQDNLLKKVAQEDLAKVQKILNSSGSQISN